MPTGHIPLYAGSNIIVDFIRIEQKLGAYDETYQLLKHYSRYMKQEEEPGIRKKVRRY